MGDFVISSRLAALPEVVWQHAVSPSGVNRELRPLLRMTFPTHVTDVTAAWHPTQPVFRSWLLLGGFLPLDYDDVTFVEVEAGNRFLERSRLLSQRLWEHERSIESAAGGCRITDRIHFVPRLAGLAPIYAPIFRTVFRLRHRNLRRLFGEVADPSSAAPDDAP